MTFDEQPDTAPSRYTTITPWVISSDTDAEISFLVKVFGGRETPGSRFELPDGRIGHVEVEIGDAVLMLFDSLPGWPTTAAHLRIYVQNTSDAFRRALDCGARAVTEPTDLPFGERVARVRDPQGHLWWIHQRVEDVPADELARRFADPDAQQAMAYVQDSLSEELVASAAGH